MPVPGERKKIAILGGGMGAMATAWTLTNEPGARERYEITVYQMGFRLGGKGASGRNPEYHQRARNQLDKRNDNTHRPKRPDR